MKRKIKLLILLEATGGGTRKYIIDFLEHLNLCKFEVIFVYSTIRADSLFLEALPRLKHYGIQLFEVPMVRGISPRLDIISFYKILRLIKSNKPDIVHCHSSKAGILGRLAAKCSLKKPITIFTPHGLSTNVSQKYWILEKIASKFTDVAIAVSESEHDDFKTQRLFNNKTSKLITLGLECEVEHSPIQIRECLGIPESSIVVASVGYLSAVKNPLGLFEVAKIVTHKNKNIHFVWIGDGDLYSVAQKFILDNKLESHCHLFGWHPFPQKILADCDIFALTSQYESFGYVLCEAMLNELPVVATDVMGPRTVVVHETTGYLIPNRDWNAFAEKLLQLAARPNVRDQLGALGKKRVKEHFNISDMMTETEKLYEQVAQSKL